MLPKLWVFTATFCYVESHHLFLANNIFEPPPAFECLRLAFFECYQTRASRKRKFVAWRKTMRFAWWHSEQKCSVSKNKRKTQRHKNGMKRLAQLVMKRCKQPPMAINTEYPARERTLNAGPQLISVSGDASTECAGRDREAATGTGRTSWKLLRPQHVLDPRTGKVHIKRLALISLEYNG